MLGKKVATTQSMHLMFCFIILLQVWICCQVTLMVRCRTSKRWWTSTKIPIVSLSHTWHSSLTQHKVIWWVEEDLACLSRWGESGARIALLSSWDRISECRILKKTPVKGFFLGPKSIPVFFGVGLMHGFAESHKHGLEDPCLKSWHPNLRLVVFWATF